MNNRRKILHVDLDAFFCAVEEQRDASLRGKPFVVGGRPEERGVVASCSYPARAFGVHSALPMSQALRLCPALIIVPANHRAYSRVSRAVMACLRALTPLVEQLSVDEAFLDVTVLAEPASTIAQQLQTQIRTTLQLPCSLGVASNKLVAKIANTVGKAAVHGGDYPRAITVVAPGDERTFLDPLPCEALWGVGPKTAARLHELGISTVGDIARWPERELATRFGKPGSDIARHARGIDPRPIETSRESKSISQETTFVRDLRDGEALQKLIREQAVAVATELRHKRLSASTVKLKIRWSDFTTLTRQSTFDQPTADAAQISGAALRLLHQSWQGEWVRLIGVGVSGLSNSARQLSFWEDPAEQIAREKEEQLHQALQQLRQRFGESAIQRGLAADDPDLKAGES